MPTQTQTRSHLASGRHIGFFHENVFLAIWGLVVFLPWTTTTRTLLDWTLTVTLIPTLRPTSTLAKLRQGLYRTSEAPLKLSHVYYNLTCNIRVAHKTITTSRRLLTNIKDKDKPEERQGAVYKIKCCDCQATYIGETAGRNLSTRLTEHKRATRNGDVNNHIAEHHLQTKHQIDWDFATCITYSTDYYQRLTLESWFTNLEQTPLNSSQQLPALYKRFIDEIKQN